MTPSPMVTMPLLDVITQMYRMAGQLKGPGRGLNGSEQTEGLHITNAMLDGVKTERWFFYQILRTEFPVVQGQQDYTVGDAGLGADWVIERPEKVLRVGVLVPGTPSNTTSEIACYNVESYEEWASIVTKQTSSNLPLVHYYQAQLPLGISSLWPVPSRDQDHQMVLYTPQTVQEFSDVMSDYIVPKGFREWMEYEGAVKVHDRYPTHPLDPNVRAMAMLYKGRVEAQICTPIFIQSDLAARRPGMAYPGYIFNGRTLLP